MTFVTVTGKRPTISCQVSDPIPALLPRQLTTFVGRHEEMRQVQRALEEYRLVTIAGPGGAGKTRLALEVALRGGPRHPDGVFLAEIEDVTDSQLVAATIAQVAGVRERPGIGVESSLLEDLRSRRCLIVVDNCEHLLDSCADLIFEILLRCPEPRILATSREPLRVPGELCWRVPPLHRPSHDDPPADLARLAEFDSVRLFLDRARTFQAGFELDDSTGPAVTRICDHLEGIPLAIELAAGRLGSASVDQVAAQLEDGLGLLDAVGGGPARQKTLRAAIDWSFSRLSRAERLVFQRCSVFAGPAGLDAVRAVCADEVVLAAEVPDTLARLLDKSLLQAETSSRGLRYRLLETLRQYGREQLEGSAQLEHFRARHAAYYASLVEASARAQAHAATETWVELLSEERSNVRSALAWSARVDPRLGLRLAAGMGWFWHTVASLAEGRRWLEKALAAPVDDLSLRAKALHSAGRIAYRQGDLAAARSMLEEALATQRGRGDRVGAARIQRSLALVLLSAGDAPAARTHLEQALAELRHHDLPLDMERTLGSLGVVALAEGNLTAARPHLEEAMTIARQLADEWGSATSLGSLGELSLESGQLDSAASKFLESMDILQRIGDGAGVAYRIEGLARVAAARRESGLALTLAAAASAVRLRLGNVAAPHWDRRLEEALAGCRSQLSLDETRSAEEAGRRMKEWEAVALAAKVRAS
jgi:predicted ATPase